MSEKKDNVQYSQLPMYEDVEASPMHKKCRRRKMVKRLGLGAIVTLFALSQFSSSSSCWKGARQYFAGQEVEDVEFYHPEELAEYNLPEPDSFVFEVADMFPRPPQFGHPVDGRPGFFNRGGPHHGGPHHGGPPHDGPHHHGHRHHGHGKHHGRHKWKHEHKHRGKKHHEDDDELEDVEQEEFYTLAFENADENVDVYKWIDAKNLDEQTDFTLDGENDKQPEEEQTFTILPFQPDGEFSGEDEELTFGNAMELEDDNEELDEPEQPEEPEEPEQPEEPHHPGRPRHPGFPGRRPHRGPHHGHRRHHGRCKNENLTSETTTLSFSPDQFKGASVILDGRLWGKVNVTQAISEDIASDDVKVKVTILSSTEKLGKAVSITSFDHEGKYTVEVKGPHHPPPPHPHGHFRHHGFGRFPPSPPHMEMEEEPSDKPKHRPEPPCLKAHITVIFPAGMKYYEDLDLHLRAAFVTSSLQELTFGKFRAGVGRGRIHFDDLTGEELHIAAVRGFITGSYKVSKLFGAGTLGGAHNITVTPTSNNVTIKAHTLGGISSVKIPANEYEGKFAVAALAGTPTVQAPNPADIHVTKLRPYLKAGYYKEKSDSAIVLSATHGIASLEFV